jgi:hypothetical protein
MMRCVPIQVFPNALTSLNSAARCRRDERENRNAIRPWRTIISLRPRYVGRTGFQLPRGQAVFARVDVAGLKSLFHPLFSCARGTQTGAFACVLKADKFSSYGKILERPESARLFRGERLSTVGGNGERRSVNCELRTTVGDGLLAVGRIKTCVTADFCNRRESSRGGHGRHRGCFTITRHCAVSVFSWRVQA